MATQGFDNPVIKVGTSPTSHFYEVSKSSRRDIIKDSNCTFLTVSDWVSV